MKLGCGLYGASFEIEKDMWGSFQKYCDIGFTAIEPFYGRKNLVLDSILPSNIRSIVWREQEVLEYQPILRKMGLDISSMHISFDMENNTEEILEEMMEFAEKTGISNFILSYMFNDYEKADKAIKAINKIQRLTEGTNIQIHYHNHSEEFTMMDEQKCFMDYFMEETHPDLKLQLDTGWVLYGGGDVVTFMEKHKDRLASVHLKDFIQGFQQVEREEAFSAIGYGVLPIAEILEISSKLKLMEHGLMIDQDHASKGAILAEDLQKGVDCVKELLKKCS